MSITDSPATLRRLRSMYAPAAVGLNVAYRTEIVSGRDRVLAHKDVLVSLTQAYGQLGSMDHLEYFLTSESSLKKTPHLILIGHDLLPGDGGHGAIAALLIYEYRVLGFGTGIFATDDTTGRRTLIAPPHARLQMARLATEALLHIGAKVVMQSIPATAEDGSALIDLASALTLATTPQRSPRRLYATRLRKIRAYLPLAETLDATFAAIGQRSRSNLRYYRRRAEAELGCNFVEAIDISRLEFQAFNRLCSYAVTDELAGSRYDSLKRVPGMFLCGIREANGQWLSMVGARRYHDMVEIDWQMNRNDLAANSLGAFFIEHEVRQGTRKMYIEGGTPHAMRHSFTTALVRDLVVRKRSWRGRPRLTSSDVAKVGRRSLETTLHRWAARFVPKNFVLQILTEEKLSWRPWPKA